MAKLNYTFDTPVPSYFRDNGWHKDYKAWAFVTWVFSRCSISKHRFYWINKEIELEPFEFIFGRDKCSEETGLSPQEVRTQLKKLVDHKMIEKSTSKSTSKYTVYKILIARFNENTNQQINLASTSNQPAINHNLDAIEYKDNNTPPPTSSIQNSEGGELPSADQIKLADLIALSQKHGFPFSAVALSDAANKFGVQNLEFALADYQTRKPTEKNLRSPNGWLITTTKKFKGLNHGN